MNKNSALLYLMVVKIVIIIILVLLVVISFFVFSSYKNMMNDIENTESSTVNIIDGSKYSDAVLEALRVDMNIDVEVNNCIEEYGEFFTEDFKNYLMDNAVISNSSEYVPDIGGHIVDGESYEPLPDDTESNKENTESSTEEAPLVDENGNSLYPIYDIDGNIYSYGTLEESENSKNNINTSLYRIISIDNKEDKVFYTVKSRLGDIIKVMVCFKEDKIDSYTTYRN